MANAKTYAWRAALGAFGIAFLKLLLDSRPFSPLAGATGTLRVAGAFVIATGVALFAGLVGGIVGAIVERVSGGRLAVSRWPQPLETIGQTSDSQQVEPRVQLVQAIHVRDEDENRIYEIVANEMDAGRTDKGLWTRLFVECNGDEVQTKVRYIGLRVKQLRNGTGSRELRRCEEHTSELEETKSGNASAAQSVTKRTPSATTDQRRAELARWEGLTTQACVSVLVGAGYRVDAAEDGSFFLVAPDDSRRRLNDRVALNEFMAFQYRPKVVRW